VPNDVVVGADLIGHDALMDLAEPQREADRRQHGDGDELRFGDANGCSQTASGSRTRDPSSQAQGLAISFELRLALTRRGHLNE
jgi:hypothetical protein